MPKKYLLYARVSPKGSTWSAEETSIGVQFAEMRAHCQRIDPGAEFIEIFDEFKSGKNLNRPGVQALLADLDHVFETLIEEIDLKVKRPASHIPVEILEVRVILHALEARLPAVMFG